MSLKTNGAAWLLAVIVAICALAVFGPARKEAHWCKPSPVEALFMYCERMAER